jgi:hypothetical protein
MAIILHPSRQADLSPRLPTTVIEVNLAGKVDKRGPEQACRVTP